MKTVAAPPTPPRGATIWPISVAAYHTLGEAGLVPERTELLYGFVYQKIPKSPYHCYLLTRLLRLLQAVVPAGCLLRSEQPITCEDSEPEPDISVVRGAELDFRFAHPKTAELVIEICVSSHEYDRSKLRLRLCRRARGLVGTRAGKANRSLDSARRWRVNPKDIWS